MRPAPYTIPTLRASRLCLRAWRDDEAQRMQQLAGDERIAATTLNVPHPYPIEAAQRFIAGHHDAAAAGTAVVWAVCTAVDDVPIGCISVGFTRDHHRCELGYWTGVDHWNQGYTTEAAAAVAAWAFEGAEVDKLTASALAENVASRRVMEKIGMRHEGLLRAQILKRDGLRDIAVYGLLRAEWDAPALRDQRLSRGRRMRLSAR